MVTNLLFLVLPITPWNWYYYFYYSWRNKVKQVNIAITHLLKLFSEIPIQILKNLVERE